jgi:hypothetical protein
VTPGVALRPRTQGSDDGEHCIDRQPIVGWRVTPIGLEPLTPDDDSEAYDRAHGVLYPDGRVNVVADRTFATEAEWVAANEEAHKEKQAQKAKESRSTPDAYSQTRGVHCELREFRELISPGSYKLSDLEMLTVAR